MPRFENQNWFGIGANNVPTRGTSINTDTFVLGMIIFVPVKPGLI